MNPVIGVSYTKLTNLYKSVRKQNSILNPFRQANKNDQKCPKSQSQRDRSVEVCCSRRSHFGIRVALVQVQICCN